MTEALAFGVLSFRILAVVMGVLIVPDSIGILSGAVETPPHSPRRNAAAWLVVSLGCIVGAVTFISRGYSYGVIVEGDMIANVAVFVIWFGLSIGLLIRAAARAKQAWVVVAAPVILLAGYAGYAMLGGPVGG